MAHEVVSQDELRSVLETRKELGEEMEPAVIEAFVSRIEARLAQRSSDDAKAIKAQRDHQKEMVLGSMAISIPLLAIAAVFTGIQGVIVVCLALAIIAIVTART